jgi:tripartite ATP-independent transporter DctM subunit
VTLRQAGKIAVEALWGLVTVIIILGGILSGVFTPTESAAVACLYAFIVTMFIYRDYRWRELPMLLHRVTKMVAMVMMLIGFSAAFGYMMALMQVPARATQFFVAIASNKYELLMMINILLILLGTFMDMAPMILICTPILLPVILKFGIDPVHFGMILLVNSGIGLITPPVGPTLFVGCAIGKVTMEEVSRELWPFYGAMCAALLSSRLARLGATLPPGMAPTMNSSGTRSQKSACSLRNDSQRGCGSSTIEISTSSISGRRRPLKRASSARPSASSSPGAASSS